MKLSIRRLRQQAYNQQNGLCYYCQFPMWTATPSEFARAHCLSLGEARKFQCTAEHLLPVAQGGCDTPENIVAACAFCNGTRHKARRILTPQDFATHVRRRVANKRWNWKFQ
jgi:hypothetical protein